MNYHANSGKVWSEAESDALKKLWKNHKTASEIATQLNVWFHNDRSRNAVIGKVHRLQGGGYNLKRRPSPIKRTAKREADHRADIVIVKAEPVDFNAKEKPECKEHPCPNPPLRGKSYCADHAKLFFIKPDPKKEPIKWSCK